MKVLKTYLVILLALLLLISCTKDNSISTVSTPIAVPITKPNSPAPVTLNNITWKVLEVNGLIYYAVTISDYQILAQNLLELKRYIEEQKGIINYYDNVINQ